MTSTNFKKGNEYTATNLRTHETFTVTCTHAGIGYTTFTDNNNKTYKGYNHSNATNYNTACTDVRNHVHIVAKVA